MCGIAILNKNNDKGNSISHRGIENNTIETNLGIKLIHHRLPIQTSLGDNWSQPIKISNGIYLLFNGEIFNYPKESFSSDTEYLLDFFSTYNSLESLLIGGIPHIQRWDGFWSIVIFDEINNKILSLTDPLGKKQLYINDLGEISSEIKPLVNDDSKLDYCYLGSIHKWGYNIDDKTPFTNIKRLLPNYIYSWNINSHQIKTSYGPYFDFYNYTPTSDPEKDLRFLLWKSVMDRLISKNYKISALISGGLDSSIIGGILIDLKANINFYTINNGDDNKYVELFESTWNKKVKRLKYDMDLSNENVIEDLKEIYCKWNESPIDLGSVVPQYNLFEAVKKEDIKIVISGDGADELFGGYRRINEYDSQASDVLHELTYYHLPRLDRMSMAHTIELRNPFLSHDIIRLGMSLPFTKRKNKNILKTAFRDIVPKEIIDRKKLPLKNQHIIKNSNTYREFVIELYKNYWIDYLKN